MMKAKQERIHTIGFSLVSKLNVQLWVRLIGMFLSLNMLFLGTSVVTLFILGEQSALQAVRVLELEGPPKLDENQWADLRRIDVFPSAGGGGGLLIPTPFRNVFPEETRSARRTVKIPRFEEDISLYHIFDTLQYKVDVSVQDVPYTIIVHFTSVVWVLKNLFVVLLIAQMVIAFKTIITRADLIRNILRPISELAEQAQTLSQEKGPLSIGEMEALAGTLDEINAARLDTRIDLDSTQDELKNLALAINSLLERINESYRLQARFVSDASHELRTPIAAIQGYANLLDRWGKNDPDALQESIDAIKEEAANMKELVEQLLFLARGDNHTMHLQIERFDLGDLARIIHGETEMISGGHIFELQIASALVAADRGLVKQAGRILVDNAIKYTPVGEKITISVTAHGDKVWFTVQDSGIGIPPEDIPYIFDRFYRADESRARATGGTGLGLSIAKWIAERHGGYLEVLSREDFGSRISLVLPASVVN